MDEQKKMRWLHISDLHFGYKSNNIVQMLEELIRQKPCFDHVDCLFLTGDFRYAKEYKDDYPDDAAYYLRSIQEKFGVRGDHVFLVPGNHDVNRIGNVLERDVDDMLKEYQARGCTIDDSPEMTTYMKRIRDHRAAFHKFYKDVKGIDAPEEWHYCVELDDFPFNIVCLDTTLACGRDNEDGSLIIGQNLLNDLAKDPRCHWERPSIVLAHHNFGSLNEKERDHLEIVLKRKMNAILYLCGHSHSVKTQDYKGRESKPLRIFIGGTGMDHTPDSWSDMDVLFGEIDPQNLKGWVKAYRWDPRYEKWISDTGFSSFIACMDHSFLPSVMIASPSKNEYPVLTVNLTLSPS